MNGLEVDMQGSLVVLRIEMQSPAGRELAPLFNVGFTPTFILLDGEGEEIWRQGGSLDADQVRLLVRDLGDSP